MVQIFTALFVIFLMLPILLWWIRNLARVFYKRDINIISENMGKIFIISIALALVFMLLMILGMTSII